MAAHEHITFRDAYRIVGKEVTAKIDEHGRLASHCPRRSLEQLVQRLHAAVTWAARAIWVWSRPRSNWRVEQAWQGRAEEFATAIEKLDEGVDDYSSDPL